ncbi:PEP-CTERM sorting domain-containing protein [Luteolibacter yonseiensis]|uniref:PEP-CTERM sorting domain-containing protein n=1 Tax=Luteolibacter yonseiensis TaxID=1144680 RepID=A0A934VAU3_9BACT|nr:VIT domain-containing protein [Luteolibacter yonseiensis]MBK1815241.1 PEP-CTERM sorting domain-containing protein [Luteolibacter yonseiensis]
MKNWTTQAEQRLTEYLDERARREGLYLEDASELKEDLRCHIYEEAEQSPAGTIGLMHLENIIGRLDAGYRPAPDPQASLPKQPKRGGFWNWTFGVVMPLVVLGLELLTSMCGSLIFNPVATWWHAAWIALVPVLNIWLMRPRGGNKTRGAAAGFVLFTALFYGLLFLPLSPFALVGVLYLGFGIIPLTPVLAAVMTWRIGRAARRDAAEPVRFRSGWRTGALAALLVIVSLEGPALWTRVNLADIGKDSISSEAGIGRLRAFHSERTLLMACYEGNRGVGAGTDISGWICRLPFFLSGGFDERGAWGTNSETTRDAFFRITGKPFNSMKPPGNLRGIALMGRARATDEFEFDDHIGGDDVAVRLKNLNLAESRFDGHVDAVSRLGYGEWTMVFKNDSANAQEARCQVRLPRDGRVSRLTLWVNGEPREAAFSTVSKVKAAYKSVAVVQRRDPVLVNMVGPDTVLVQCFPVPAHGSMKIRFGITAPLDGIRWEMPYVVERNFGLKENLEHAVWLQGGGTFDLAASGKTQAAGRDGEGHSLAASLGKESLMASGVTLATAPLPEDPGVVWCEDRFAKPGGRFLTREPVTVTRPAASRVVVVIDGSSSMAVAKDWLVKSLGKIDREKVSLMIADDRSRRVTPEELENYDFTGGRDNEPALREGIRLAKESNSPVVWIHGPQSVRLSQPEALLQLLERGTVLPVIHDVEAVSGPNRLGEALFRSGCLHRGPALVSPEKDLRGFLDGLQTERREFSWNWKRTETSEGLPGSRVWDHLARQWAAATAENPKTGMDDAARSELAAGYQLVTPVSGAVVLETQQQYREHGLTPVDGSATPSIPSVPEPSTGLLVILTTAAALMRRKRAA